MIAVLTGSIFHSRLFHCGSLRKKIFLGACPFLKDVHSFWVEKQWCSIWYLSVLFFIRVSFVKWAELYRICSLMFSGGLDHSDVHSFKMNWQITLSSLQLLVLFFPWWEKKKHQKHRNKIGVNLNVILSDYAFELCDKRSLPMVTQWFGFFPAGITPTIVPNNKRLIFTDE